MVKVVRVDELLVDAHRMAPPRDLRLDPHAMRLAHAEVVPAAAPARAVEGAASSPGGRGGGVWSGNTTQPVATPETFAAASARA